MSNSVEHSTSKRRVFWPFVAWWFGSLILSPTVIAVSENKMSDDILSIYTLVELPPYVPQYALSPDTSVYFYSLNIGFALWGIAFFFLVFTKRKISWQYLVIMIVVTILILPFAALAYMISGVLTFGRGSF